MKWTILALSVALFVSLVTLLITMLRLRKTRINAESNAAYLTEIFKAGAQHLINVYLERSQIVEILKRGSPDFNTWPDRGGFRMEAIVGVQPIVAVLIDTPRNFFRIYDGGVTVTEGELKDFMGVATGFLESVPKRTVPITIAS